MHSSIEQIIAVKRGSLGLELFQFGVQTLKCGRAKSRAHLASILELSRLVISDQQGAESSTAAFRIGIAANHKFLFANALELEPVTGATGNVHPSAALAMIPSHPLRQASLK